MKDIKVSVLGTIYSIKYGTYKKYRELNDMDGFTDTSTHTIIVDDMTECEGQVGCKADLIAYRKQVVRHEIIHAFLNESGLSNNSFESSNWATNEEMVDWLSIQFPKIYKAFVDADCI